MKASPKSKNKSYGVWRGMIGRCTKPKNSRYRYYGARGIKVCDRWMEYENFKADMGEPPPGLWLERNNNDGHYEPTNCRWATPKEQGLNKRNTRCVDWMGFQIPMSKVCDVMGVKAETVRQRINRGWTEDEAVSPSKRPHPKLSPKFKIVWNGKETTLAEICKQRGLDYKVMYSRVANGWDIQTAVITPIRKKKPARRGKKSKPKKA